MQERNIALSIVFTIITCGIYGIYWFICLTNDANYANNEQGTSGAVAFLLTLVTCGIYGLYWAYRMGDIINSIKAQRGFNVDGSMPVIYLILQLLSLGIVGWALMQNDLNRISHTEI